MFTTSWNLCIAKNTALIEEAVLLCLLFTHIMEISGTKDENARLEERNHVETKWYVRFVEQM